MELFVSESDCGSNLAVFNKLDLTLSFVTSKPRKEPLDSPPRAAMVYTHVVAFDEVRKMYAHLHVEQHVFPISLSSSLR